MLIERVVLVAFVVATSIPQVSPSVSDFRAADPVRKERVLNDIAALQSALSIADVIDLASAGMHDASPRVRMAALAAVQGRAIAARWAGTPGPA